MKKIKYILAGLLAVLAISSCDLAKQGTESIFPDDPAVRTNAAMAECFELLSSADNGWAFTYYPSANKTYGGYAFAAKFNKAGDVEVTTETADDYTQTAVSHFSINASSGPLLSFDTYNEYIHAWSDPDGHSGNIYEGDFEFAYVSGTKDEMIFRGIKTGNRIVFTRLETDIVTYMSRVIEMRTKIDDNMFVGYKFISQRAEPMEMEDSDDYNVLTYYPKRDKETKGETVNVAYGFTDKGMNFATPVTIDGATAQHFLWSDANGRFESTDAVFADSGTSTQVYLEGFHSENYIPYADVLGEYDLYFQYNTSTGSGTVLKERVTISEDVYNSTYRMTIWNENTSATNNYKYGPFSVTLRFSKSGNIMLNGGQYIGPVTYSGVQRHGFFLMFKCTKGSTSFSLSTSTTYGMILKHHTDEEGKLVFVFEDNGVWKAANSFGVYAYTDKSTSSTRNGRTHQFYWTEKLVKRN